MKRTLAAAAFLLVPLALPAVAQETNEEKLQVLRRILAATVKVSVEYGNGLKGHGTGVSVVKVASGDLSAEYSK